MIEYELPKHLTPPKFTPSGPTCASKGGGEGGKDLYMKPSSNISKSLNYGLLELTVVGFPNHG